MAMTAEIVSAGAVVSRNGESGREILLVHRPKYDDWSFPKGKLDPGEHAVAAAVREVGEETGLNIRLGPRLGTQRYMVGNGAPRPKDVHYWVGQVVGDDDVSSYRPNQEIDKVVWVPLDHAPGVLTYDHDRSTIAEFEAVQQNTYPLLVLRHGRARPRNSWRDDDRDRPLSVLGEVQSEQLVPLLAAFGVQRILSSSSRRCWSTVVPFSQVAGLDIEVTDDLTEEEASGAAVEAQVQRLLSWMEPAVLCTHRPVLPRVFEALSLNNRKMAPADIVLAHHRHGKVVSLEHHGVNS